MLFVCSPTPHWENSPILHYEKAPKVILWYFWKLRRVSFPALSFSLSIVLTIPSYLLLQINFKISLPILHKITCRDLVIIMLTVDREVGRNGYHNHIGSSYPWAFVGFSLLPSFFPFNRYAIYFLFLSVALVRAFSRMLRRNSGKTLPCPDPDFSGKLSRFSLLECSICSRSSSYSLSIMKSPLCLPVYWAPVIASCQALFPSTLIWRHDFFLFSWRCDWFYHLTWEVWSALHPWDKSFLAVGVIVC